MKHILILISILLLSSPLFGYPPYQQPYSKCEGKFFKYATNYVYDPYNNRYFEGETLYGWTATSGIIWFTQKIHSSMPIYKGEIKNEKPDGFGILCLPVHESLEYVGFWKDGIFWRGNNYDRRGIIVNEYVNGKGINQHNWFYNVNKVPSFWERVKKFVFNLFQGVIE